MAKKIIVANWKLNPATLKEAEKLVSTLVPRPKNTVVVCPPTIFLSSLKYKNLGAQDCFWQERGPFTGQTSPAQLKSLKIKYCIVGHSEKRAVGETDSQVNLKLKAIMRVGIVPILCIGFGTTVEQDDLEVTDVLKQQLDQDLSGLNTENIIVAYEPVWSISSGNPYATKKVCTPDHAEKISIFIKTKYKIKKVLYGGSANDLNAKDFLKQPSIDGLLVGGASLIPSQFNKIINY